MRPSPTLSSAPRPAVATDRASAALRDASDASVIDYVRVRVGRGLGAANVPLGLRPGAGDSVSLARRLSDRLDTPLIGGEYARTGPTGVTNVLAQDVYEFIRADVFLDGGITGAMKMARVAESFGVDVEFHVSGPATLQCLSAVRNTNYFEHGLLHPRCEWKNGQALERDVDRPDDGRVSIPDGPGLGVDVDWAFVEERRTGRTVIDADGRREID